MSYISVRMEIKNLIAKAVTKTKARRNCFLDRKASLFFLTNEQSELITGGINNPHGCIPDQIKEKTDEYTENINIARYPF